MLSFLRRLSFKVSTKSFLENNEMGEKEIELVLTKNLNTLSATRLEFFKKMYHKKTEMKFYCKISLWPFF